MFLTLKPDDPLLASAKPRRHRRAVVAPLPPSAIKPFEEALNARLKSLLPVPPALPLAFLSLAADLLSATLSDFAALIASDPAFAASDPNALAAHLDASIALLDACNAVSALIDRLSRRRLLLRLALHHLSSPNPDALRRARAAIGEFQSPPPDRAIRGSDLIVKSCEADPPRGRKISAVRRAIYAVEAVSGLVIGAALVVLGGAERAEVEIAGICASKEFDWAEAFNKVAAAVCRGLPESGAAAAAEVERRVSELAAAIDGEEEAARLKCAVELTDKATEKLTEGLETLGNAVSRVFRSGLSTRNTVLNCFRVVPQKCK